MTEKPSYTAQGQVQHIRFQGEKASWSSTTLQQISSLEQLVLQALLYHTLLDFCFGLFWFLEPNVLTTFAVWICLKESYPKSFCCLLCRNVILAAVMCRDPSSTLALSHMEANHISAPVQSGVTPSCVSSHHTVTPHSISLHCWAQLPAMQKGNTRESVPITCLSHHFTFSLCRRHPWVPLWPSRDLFAGTGIPEQSWACTLLQTCIYYSTLSVAAQFTLKTQLPQILGLQGDTVHHLG